MAGFLLGTPTATGKSSQFIKMNSLENQWAFYGRDRWSVNSKLTLDLGLRWELYPNRHRSAGLGIESYDPTTNEALIGGRGGIPQDNNVGWSKKLFAPRLGFAYQMNESTVIRSGYGITYHSHPWGAQALRGWFPLTVIAVFEGTNGFAPVTTSPGYVEAGVPNAPLGPEVGIPSICCPDISTGRVPLPNTAETGYPVANQLLHRGYIQSWNLIVERKLPGQLVGSVGYVGSASVRGFAFLDINASQIPGSGDDGRPLFQQFGRTATTREFDGRTHSNYHSLQMTLNRRFTDGLMIKAAYTYSKAIDEAAYSDWTEFMWNAPSVFSRNRAQADFNIPQIFQFAAVYELPFGPEQEVGDQRHERRNSGRLAAQRSIQRLRRASVHRVRFGRVVEYARQRADGGSDQAGCRNIREDRRCGDVLRHLRICPRHRRAVRQHGPQHSSRARRGESRHGPVPHVQADGPVPAAGPGRGVQREQHAALREPGQRCQQLGLRQDFLDERRRCPRAVAGVPLRLCASSSSVVPRSCGRSHQPMAASAFLSAN